MNHAYEYKISEWRDQFRSFLDAKSSSKDQFLAQFEDRDEASWKFDRFDSARSYLNYFLDHDIDALEGTALNVGLVNVLDDDLIITLWRVFSQLPDSRIGQSPPIEFFRSELQKQKNRP